MSVKKVTDAVAKRRLLALANLLESGEVNNHFYFGSWGDTVDPVEKDCDVLADPVRCGTTACALGWAPALPFAKKLGFRLSSQGRECGYARFTKNGRFVTPGAVAKTLFGLSELQSDMLFNPGDTMPIPLEKDATPVQVAENIREFVRIRFG